MFCNQEFSAANLKLESGDTLILYTDGVVDAVNKHDEEYGMSRLFDIATEFCSWDPDKFVASCVSDLSKFRGSSPRFDDISILAIRRG